MDHMKYMEYKQRGDAICEEWIIPQKRQLEAELAALTDNIKKCDQDQVEITTKEVAINTFSKEYRDLLALDIFFRSHAVLNTIFNVNNPQIAPTTKSINQIYRKILAYDENAKHHNNIFFKVRYLLIVYYLDMIRDTLFSQLRNE
eukprot:UN02392